MHLLSPRDRIVITSVEGFADRTVTCGGTKPRGSHARIVGRRSTGSRAMSACRMAPTGAPEGSRWPHSSNSLQAPTRFCGQSTSPRRDSPREMRSPRVPSPNSSMSLVPARASVQKTAHVITSSATAAAGFCNSDSSAATELVSLEVELHSLTVEGHHTEYAVDARRVPFGTDPAPGPVPIDDQWSTPIDPVYEQVTLAVANSRVYVTLMLRDAPAAAPVTDLNHSRSELECPRRCCVSRLCVPPLLIGAERLHERSCA